MIADLLKELAPRASAAELAPAPVLEAQVVESAAPALAVQLSGPVVVFPV
jgi:hypothetical protein